MESNFVVERKDIKEAGLTEIFKKETKNQDSALGEILFITSYPPRECGIASYSQNLINSIKTRFINNYNFKICALEPGDAKYYYPPEVTMVLKPTDPSGYSLTLNHINKNPHLKVVVIQHEFDLFGSSAVKFSEFIKQIDKPLITVFHTVIQTPDTNLKRYVREVAAASRSIIVLARITENILVKDYGIAEEKIEVIPYGTHLIKPSASSALKEKYKLSGKNVLSSIGMLSPDKGIEVTLEALPLVIKKHPETIFLVIGKTHPEEFKKDGEKYRIMLESKVKSLKLQNHVQFLNVFSTPDILREYFQLSDICIFSGKNPDRPTSGMFAYAVSSGCAIISTPTPHAYEFLGDGAGFIYKNSLNGDLSSRIIQLLDEPALRKSFSENIVKKSISAIWENSALLHQNLFNKISGHPHSSDFSYPVINLNFLKSMTDRVGMVHSSNLGEPDLRTGYYLDDNAIALFVFCMHFKITGDINDVTYIRKYLKFIYHCYQPSGQFLKYVDHDRRFTSQNYNENLEETHAKAIWALGYLFSMKGLLPNEMTDVAGIILDSALPRVSNFTSGKSIALVIKGLYYYYSVNETPDDLMRIKTLANKLVEMYKQNSNDNWKWFENKFSSSASILPGALLNTWLTTGEQIYKDIAKESFEFLTSKTFNNNSVQLNSKSDWQNEDCIINLGEQPCDIAFNVITLSKFYLMCKESEYFLRMDAAFKWFLGNNRLNQMIYNPATGSCFDGLEENSVCTSQSADSALCFILARMVVEKYKFKGENHINYIV